MLRKNKEILTFFNGCGSLKEKKLPVKLGYAIKKNISAVSDAVKAYEEEYKELLNKYGSKDENGNLVEENGRCPIEDGQNFTKDLEELLDIETEVNIHTITEDDLRNCDDPRYDPLSVSDLDTLEIMIKE